MAPEIPQNTGSIGRVCAATRTPLHLIEPLGFSLEDRYLKRAGLDYWPYIDLTVHADWSSFMASQAPPRRLGFSARATRSYTTIDFAADDWLVFGCETRGLPPERQEELDPLYRIPLAEPGVRSLNLANAVSIVLFEGLRQLGHV